ncbi:MAG: hypothetical protein LBP37_07590 [Spirochaetaceae bacterium]|jgi:hypothetical protein|nr:hypothetical protein [Spirochaetaceae bacterium]
MLARGGAVYRFVVLVPHANARAEFGKYCRESFSSGGVEFCSFPAVAPFARVDVPASKTELKSLAALFRLQSYESGGGGKISAGQISSILLPDGTSVAGPRLSIEPPPLPETMSASECFSQLVLGAGLFQTRPPLTLPPLTRQVSFSAAAAANMRLETLEYGHSYFWTIGETLWLPAVKKGAKGVSLG